MTSNQERYDVVIIGGGAAGLFCASQLDASELKSCVLEHNQQFGRKILISGGGRCNFTNKVVSSDHFSGKNPYFSKSPLSRYSNYDFIELVEKYNISYFEKTLGQLFCKSSSKEILNLLLNECKNKGVELKNRVKVKSVAFSKESRFYDIEINDSVIKTKNLVIATGGLSLPSLGASSFGLEVAKSFGHTIIETKPALVPLTLDQKKYQLDELSGVSLYVMVKNFAGVMFKESLLFTHRGLSGPAILQISSFWKKGDPLIIDFIPSIDLLKEILELKEKSGRERLLTHLKRHFPERFILKWLSLCEIKQDVKIAEISKEKLKLLVEKLKAWEVIPIGTEGYRKAEVMKGGVSVDEVHPKTMESKLSEGLYFIGEVLDTTGHLGGYNFQWAWSTGYVCAQEVKKRSSLNGGV